MPETRRQCSVRSKLSEDSESAADLAPTSRLHPHAMRTLTSLASTAPCIAWGALMLLLTNLMTKAVLAAVAGGGRVLARHDPSCCEIRPGRGLALAAAGTVNGICSGDGFYAARDGAGSCAAVTG